MKRTKVKKKYLLVNKMMLWYEDEMKYVSQRPQRENNNNEDNITEKEGKNISHKRENQHKNSYEQNYVIQRKKRTEYVMNKMHNKQYIFWKAKISMVIK